MFGVSVCNFEELRNQSLVFRVRLKRIEKAVEVARDSI